MHVLGILLLFSLAAFPRLSFLRLGFLFYVVTFPNFPGTVTFLVQTSRILQDPARGLITCMGFSQSRGILSRTQSPVLLSECNSLC